MMMINKKNGELITCAFNVFHTNFLIKHNCVLTEPSTFLFSSRSFFSLFDVCMVLADGIYAHYFPPPSKILIFRTRARDAKSSSPYFCISLQKPTRIVNVHETANTLGKLIQLRFAMWTRDIYECQMLLDIKRLVYFRGHFRVCAQNNPRVFALATAAARIAVRNGAAEGITYSSTPRTTTTPYRLSRAELFRRSARAITLLLARNNAAPGSGSVSVRRPRRIFSSFCDRTRLHTVRLYMYNNNSPFPRSRDLF